jgi:CRISPR-associated endonuclease Cas1
MLTGHGVRLSIDHGALLVRHGLTHHPQKPREQRFFPRDPELPSRILLLDGSGSISFDVLSWLAEQGVPLVRLGWRGEVLTTMSGQGYSANPYRVQWQLETRVDPKRRMAFCIDLIARKIEGCIRTLEKAIRRSPDWEKAMERAYADLTRLECDPPRDIISLRALEAGSAAAYFRAWRAVPLKWVGTSRRPIPNGWRAIGSRTSIYKLAGNRNAAHPVNAILNYAYTVLESEVRIKAIADGYDPTIGIMHERREGSSAFVFDMMEPERPKVDRAVIEFLKAHTFHPADFTIRSDGVCRLNPEMGREIVRVAARAIS